MVKKTRKNRGGQPTPPSPIPNADDDDHELNDDDDQMSVSDGQNSSVGSQINSSQGSLHMSDLQGDSDAANTTTEPYSPNSTNYSGLSDLPAGFVQAPGAAQVQTSIDSAATDGSLDAAGGKRKTRKGKKSRKGNKSRKTRKGKKSRKTRKGKKSKRRN